MSTVETRVPQSQEEVTQALHDAFDLITSDPTRRAMSCKNLLTCRDVSSWGEPDAEGNLDTVTFQALHVAPRNESMVHTLRNFVMSLWTDNLNSANPTGITEITLQCQPDNEREYVRVLISWASILL